VAAGAELTSGITVDVVKVVFAKLNRPVQLRALSWVICRRAVAEGRLDGAIDATPAPDELAGSHFSSMYPLAVFVAADSPVKHFDPGELSGRQVGMVRGYRYGHVVSDHADWHRVDASSDEQLMTWLKLKRVEFVVTDAFAGPRLAAKVGVEVRQLTPLLDVSPLYVAFNANDAELAAGFDITLAGLIADGTIDTIYRKYLPYDFREASKRWFAR
jgi:polar amino acid transport system substrate-binding protein